MLAGFSVGLILFVGLPSLSFGGEALDAARAHRLENGSRILSEFADLLRIPNVASDSANIRHNAATLVDLFEQRGASMQLLQLPGAPPLVVGRLQAPQAVRTLGIYVHYDGQPVNESEWKQAPWEPTLYTDDLTSGGEPRPFPGRGDPIDPAWRIYARSAGDDKVPFPAILSALDALQEAKIDRTSNLVFLFEGEEEAGSPHLAEYFRRFKDRLDADLWLICDGPLHQSRRPQLVFGVRGYTKLELTVYGATRDLHSGHYGNWAPNPAMMLSQLLSSMKDERGNVLIEGFFDTVSTLDEAAREALAAVPDTEVALQQELGLVRVEGNGESLGARLLLPSLNVRGLSSAEVGAKARNIIPATATASIDIRLVAGNDPDHMLDLVEAHIQEQGYFIIRSEPDLETRLSHSHIARVVRSESGYVAARTEMSHPIVEPLRAAARAAAGEEVILLPSMGGSLPLYLFNQILGRPVVIVPIANHDDNQHAPNENIRIANLWYGIDLMSGILTMPPY